MNKSGIGTGLFSPKNRSLNRSSLSSRKTSNQKPSTLSNVIYKSPLNKVETFGPPLPVLVREALTFSERSASACVRVSSEGWAWFVCGRRLLVWSCFSEDTRRRQVTTLCRELSLPSSDLAYRAELVTIFTNPQSQVPSCLAASPEGVVRYWPSIAHEGTSIEVNAELQGQECDSLTDFGSLGAILATTTASIVLLTPQNSNGRPIVTVKLLRAPQGWLGGITRFIPSVIFGSLQSSQSMEDKLVKVVGVPRSGGAWLLHVLAGHTLQKWLLVQGELQSIVFECDVAKIGAEAFHKTIWESSGGNISDVQVWLLDLQSTENGVCVLLGATNSQISPQFFYALGSLNSNLSGPPTKFDRFCPVKPNVIYRESDEAELLSCRVLLYGTSALLYTRRRILAVSAVNFGEDVDLLDVVDPMDEVLGASLCKGIPILFTKEHGLISVHPAGVRSELNGSVSDVATADSSILSLHHEPLTIAISENELEELETNPSVIHQFQAAFLYFLRKNNENAERIINAILPSDDESALEGLSLAIAHVSLEMIDSHPIADPRWAGLKGTCVLGSTSLQTLAQLEDKMRTSDALVAFLKWAKLWPKLKFVGDEEVTVPLKIVLSEHREKLIVLHTLKQLHNMYGSLLDQCVRHVTGESVPDGLTPHDIFYCHVSNAHIDLQAVVDWSEVAGHRDGAPQDSASAIATANEVLLKTIQAISDWRNHHLSTYITATGNQKSVEYLPWTAAPGPSGLRDSLNVQYNLTLKYGARAISDLSLRSKLYEQLMKLGDALLDGWRSHIRSIRGLPKHDALSQQYESVRVNLIKPFIVDREYERAAILAEKYLCFHSLVQICELTDNMERLDAYCNNFSEQGFSQFLFNWYIREGRPGTLLERFRARAKPSQQEQLSQFLGDHPTLSWVQDVLRHDFTRAATTLETIGNNEKDLLYRKKTIVSLSKLCLLASDESDEVAEEKLNNLDAELELMFYQEELPSAVLSAHCYDKANLRVLTPSEIIKLYISEQNETASESDYKTALDLLNFIQDDLERSQLRHSIWCSAILRDSWNEVDAETPLDSVLNLLVFKLIDLLECLGCSLAEVVPPIATILEAEELGDLRNNRQFQYLIRLGYEHFQKVNA